MQNDELGVLRRRYVRYLRLERGYSDNTIEAYTHDIDYLLNYLRNENLKVEDVKLEHLQNFAAVIYEFGIASSSQARILCGVNVMVLFSLLKTYLPLVSRFFIFDV
jgi:integrase/recombinase XerD